jgi:23S rRNA pseudouridine955/2504/2580 synthase
MTGVSHREVTTAEAELRFDRWVKRHFPGLGHVQLQKLLRTGQFRVDGKRVTASTRVQPGQTVRVPPVDAEKPAVRRGPSEADTRFIRGLVIHDDDEVVVLNKPAGLAVQGGSKTTRHIDGMLDALAKGGERPKLVHRLDRDTSGVLVLARNAVVARELMHAFQQHEVRKLYWAIVQGNPDRNAGLIDLRLGKSGADGREKMTPEALDAKRARTDFRVIARAGKIAAWVGLVPLTGRTHQLRAHMQAIGAPIVGDHKYGPAGDGQPATAPKGLMLHAREIELPRGKGRPLRITADPPPHFLEGLKWLGLTPEALPFTRLQDWPEAG